MSSCKRVCNCCRGPVWKLVDVLHYMFNFICHGFWHWTYMMDNNQSKGINKTLQYRLLHPIPSRHSRLLQKHELLYKKGSPEHEVFRIHAGCEERLHSKMCDVSSLSCCKHQWLISHGGGTSKLGYGFSLTQ